MPTQTDQALGVLERFAAVPIPTAMAVILEEAARLSFATNRLMSDLNFDHNIAEHRLLCDLEASTMLADSVILRKVLGDIRGQYRTSWARLMGEDAF